MWSNFMLAGKKNKRYEKSFKWSHSFNKSSDTMRWTE